MRNGRMAVLQDLKSPNPFAAIKCWEVWVCVICFVVGVWVITTHMRKKKKRAPETTESFGPQAEPAEINQAFSGILPTEQREGVCHPSCCLSTQWPTPFEKDADMNEEFGDKTSIQCRSCQTGVGCLCTSKTNKITSV